MSEWTERSGRNLCASSKKKELVLWSACIRHTPGGIYFMQRKFLKRYGYLEEKYLLLWLFYFHWKWAAPRVFQMFTVRQNTFFTRTDHLPTLFYTLDWAIVLCSSCHKISSRPSHLCQHRPCFRVLGDTVTCLELTRSSHCIPYTTKWARCTKTCIR